MRRSPTKRLLFRMALKLGWVNPYKMARTIPARLLQEWEAYSAIEPFDEVRADYRSAQIAAMLYNINRDARKDPNGKPIHEFLLQFDREEPTAEEKAKTLNNKMRVMELIMRAQAEVAAEQQAAAPPKVIEVNYPLPTNDAVQAALAKARAASRQVDN